MTINIIKRSTPNYKQWSIPREVKAIVIHIAQGSEKGVDSWFGYDPSDVSSQFLIGLDGEVRQYVSVHDVAYANGEVVHPTWNGLIAGLNPNYYTISIEHEGFGDKPWPEQQLAASALISAWCCLRFKIRPSSETIVKHSEIKSTKACPGKYFDRDNYVERVKFWVGNFTLSEVAPLIRGLR